MNKTKFDFSGNYISGKFTHPEDRSGDWKVLSPADLKDEMATIAYSYSDVDKAVECARTAYKKWRKVPLGDRITTLRKYQDALKRKTALLAEAISREMGKPLWEAESEVKTMIGKVEVTANEGMKLIEEKRIESILPGATGVWWHQSLGVMAVIGPFNFPGHLANGHIVPALMTGNTVIFKPSEKTPLTGQIMAECFHEAGIPSGVFNLVQGEKEVGRRLCVHEGVDGVLFTGSYEVGNRIQQDTLTQHWKILALEMGGKNSSIVCKDADLDVAIRETLVSAYLTTGQRCSCTSRILVHQTLMDEFVSKFHEKAKSFAIGHPLTNPFMGPLIDKSSVDRYIKFQGMAEREGAEIIMSGKRLQLEWDGYYVTPSICLLSDGSVETAKKSVYQQTEIFAPNVAIIPFTEIEQAIELANVTQYGLVCSVFSKSHDVFQLFLDDLRMGLINWNRSTCGASGRLPFGGIKKSGNFYPTGITASYYCTYPVASLEIPNPSATEGNYPGLDSRDTKA